MMCKKHMGLMVLMGIAAVMGMIGLAMMCMEKQESKPDGTLVNRMQNMAGMLS